MFLMSGSKLIFVTTVLKRSQRQFSSDEQRKRGENMSDYSKPVKIVGSVGGLFRMSDVIRIAYVTNYNSKVLQNALDRIEQLEDAVFKKEEGEKNE